MVITIVGILFVILAILHFIERHNAHRLEEEHEAFVREHLSGDEDDATEDDDEGDDDDPPSGPIGQGPRLRAA